MTFFYNINKKLDEIRTAPNGTHGQLNERNMKYNNTEVDEGLGDMTSKVGSMVKKAGGSMLDRLNRDDGADQIRDL